MTRNATLVAAVVTWITVVLVLDAGASLGQQQLLGLATWLVLLLALRGETTTVRVQVGVVVVFATAVEYLFSHWLGVYEYRLDGVPAFVPPGHGLVYLAALSFGRTAFAHGRARPLVRGVLTVGALWALWGVALSPQPDALGAFWFGCLVLFAWKGRSPLLYVGAFGVVSYLEILGTSLGTWTWGAVDPVVGVVTIGNPPSGIAGGYAWFDAAALWLTPLAVAWWQRRGDVQAGTSSSVRCAAGSSLASTTTALSTSTPPAACSGPSRSPSTRPATTMLTTGSAVDTTAVSDGPSLERAAKNALTATTVPISATPTSASQADGACGRRAPVPTASRS